MTAPRRRTVDGAPESPFELAVAGALTARGLRVVTQVGVTDGAQSAEAISFFTVAGDKITRLVEYWPEPFSPAENRRHLTEPVA